VGKIIIAGIEFFAFGGVSAAERQVGQRYRANIELELDLEQAARTDDLGMTVNYAAVVALAVETAREGTNQLLESMAARIADAVLTTYPVSSVTVQLQKLLPPIDYVVAYAAVEITRHRLAD
jgi:dihydroneopterin aldolase